MPANTRGLYVTAEAATHSLLLFSRWTWDNDWSGRCFMCKGAIVRGDRFTILGPNDHYCHDECWCYGTDWQAE